MAVTTTTASLTNPCQFYKVALNPNTRTPILGTMQAYTNNKIQDPCKQAWLPPYQMTVPAGKSRCMPTSHIRYYYKINNITKNILANSLFQHIGAAPRCDAQYTILEYIPHN